MDRSFYTQLEAYSQQGFIPKKYQKILLDFYNSYMQVILATSENAQKYTKLFLTFLDLVKEQFKHPYAFKPYHQCIRTPFDYYQLGIDFIRPLIDFSHSSISGQSHLQEILSHLSQRSNVILLANHQIEADPQVISIMLEDTAPDLAEKLVLVAGERVVTDPLAMPFSMGRNLLCIYSKKYIDNPPEEKLKKQLHNKKTMQLMSNLLSEGGCCIYVAPSGGRDRKNKQGIVEVAPFDPQSIEMFYLMSKKARKPTFFFPLALATYCLLPPPETVQIELGESRLTQGGAVHLAFGKQIDMDHFPGGDVEDKHEKRKIRANYIWNLVNMDYKKFPLLRSSP